MENFLSQLTLRFDTNPDTVVINAMRYYYSLDDMLFILHCYHFNLQDPFIDQDYYHKCLKRQGIRYIINTLCAIHAEMNREENKTLSQLVMSDYQIS